MNSPALFAELARLYAEMESEVAALGGRCERSGRCCRFADFGHKLFLSTPELAYFVDGVDLAALEIQDGVCPFLITADDGRPACGNREHRAIGCRVFFCNIVDQTPVHAITEKYLTKMKELGARFGLEHRYGELTEMMREAKAALP